MGTLMTIWAEEPCFMCCGEGSAAACLCRLASSKSERKKMSQTCQPAPDFSWYAKLNQGYYKQRDRVCIVSCPPPFSSR